MTHQPLLEKLLFVPKSLDAVWTVLASALASVTVKETPAMEIVAFKVALEALGATTRAIVPGPLPVTEAVVIQLGKPETVHEQVV